MIIGIDISSLPYGTGVSNYTLNLVKHLLKLDTDNTYKLFYSSLRLPIPQEITKLVHKHSNVTLYHFKIPLTLLSFIWNKIHIFPIEWFIGHCNIFHTSDWTHPPTLKAKTISTIHDLTPFLFPQWLNPKIVNNHKSKLNASLKQNSFYICVSKNSLNDLLKIFPQIERQNTTVIYEAAEDKYSDFYKLNQNHKSQLISSIKNKYNLKDYLLAQGTREPRKNLALLIKAFLKYKKLHPKSTLQLAIAGKYGWGKDITSPISDIKILGFVAENDLVQLHAAAVALVFPSLYEGFGLPVVKAMAVGTPVITSANSSLKEIAHNSALLINPKSTTAIIKAIEKISKNNVRINLIKKGIQRAKIFSWTTTAQSTLKIYQKIYADRN